VRSCPKCLNLSPDHAVACSFCGTVLDDSVIARAQGPARTSTLLETPGGTRPSPPPSLSEYRPAPPPSLADYRPAPPPAPASAAATPGRRGETVFVPPTVVEAPSGPSTPRAAVRKVIAVLLTYSWDPQGQMFPIREGRNLIGRGEECEVRITTDPALSQVNSHITFRQSFVLGDMVSMSGTDLNGEPVEEQFRPLQNYSTIRTGSTIWTFVIVDPAILG